MPIQKILLLGVVVLFCCTACLGQVVAPLSLTRIPLNTPRAAVTPAATTSEATATAALEATATTTTTPEVTPTVTTTPLPPTATPTPTVDPLVELLNQPLSNFVTGECLAADATPSRLPAPTYGINAFLFDTDAERVLTLADNANFTWLRQQIHWRDHEHAPGMYTWEPLDRIIKQARAHNMRVMLSVVRSPAWATSNGPDGLPTDVAAFARFMQVLSDRYRGIVSAYQVWNEPNLSHENGGTPGTPENYLALLEAAYPAIKATDPCALVVSAALAATNAPDPTLATADLPFFRRLYELNDGAFLRSADVVALHTGAGPHAPTERWTAALQSSFYFRHIERSRAIMTEFADPREVWISEVGWATYAAPGSPEPVSELEQATYLTDALWYTRQYYPWVAAVFVWNLNFAVTGSTNDEKSTFSLLDADWRPRPAYLTLQREVELLRARNARPTFSENTTHYHRWTFESRSPIDAGPLLASDGTLYVSNEAGQFYALDATGAPRWSVTAPNTTGNIPARNPDNGTLYLGSTILLNAISADGRLLWSRETRGRLRGSPIYLDNTIFVVSRDGEVQALNPNGEERWWFNLHTVATELRFDPGSPGGREPTLLVASGSGEVYRLTLTGRLSWKAELNIDLDAPPVPGPDGSTYVVSNDGTVFKLDSRGNVVWSVPLEVRVSAAPLVGQRNQLYITSESGRLFTLDTTNGRLLWSHNTGSALHAPPVQGPDGIIYVGTASGQLLALSPTGMLRWQAQVQGQLHTSPVLGADGGLYITSSTGRAYAFGRLP